MKNTSKTSGRVCKAIVTVLSGIVRFTWVFMAIQMDRANIKIKEIERHILKMVAHDLFLALVLDKTNAEVNLPKRSEGIG